MTPSQQLDLICRAIEDHNRYVSSSHKIKAKHNELGLILLGDAGQLPAVSKPSTQGRYNEEFGGDLQGIQDTPAKPFFMAKYWDKFVVHQLTEVKRQTDKEFVEKLMLIREGRVKEAVDWFEEKVGFNKTIDDSFIGSTFFPTNKEVDNYNNLKLKQLPGGVTEFKSERKGKQISDWKNIPDSLYLKKDCKVMLLCNNFTAGFANGELGYVVDTLAEGILVKLQRNDKVVLIEYKELENSINCKNTKTDKYYSKVIGTIRYLPVRQGDSSSIHKCLSGDTLVLTNKGHIPLKELTEGTQVITSDNTTQSVLAHVNTGFKLPITIMSNEGHKIVASEDHRFLIRTKEGEEIFKEVKDITNEDYLCVPRPKSNTIRLVKYNNLSWFLGALVGDGSYNDNVHYRVSFTKNSNIFEKYVKIGESLGLKITKRLHKDKYRKTPINDCYFHSKEYRLKLIELGLDYAKAASKKVPHFILNNDDLNCVAGFLQGLFDTDGSVSLKFKNIRLSTSSEFIANQTQLLLNRFGILANVTKFDSKNINHNNSFHVSISGATNVNLFKDYISFSEESKLDKLNKVTINAPTGKTMIDWIPLSKEKLETIRKDLRGLPKSGRVRALFNGGIENLSYTHLDEIINLYTNKAPQYLLDIKKHNYFYSKVKSIEVGTQLIEMYDIEVENNPTFIANGVVSHNSQSLTLDNVQIDLNHWFLSTLSGGLYTALSRVTSYKGLRLVGTREQFIKACYINPKCLEFIKYLKSQLEYEKVA